MLLELPHMLRVCRSCRYKGTPRDGTHPGALFVIAVEARFCQWKYRDRVLLLPTNCLTQCDDPCAASLSAQGKLSPTIVGMEPDEATANALLEYTEAYIESADGQVHEEACPPVLRGKVSLLNRRA